MVVKRVAGALGAELQAVNLGDGIDAELAGTLRALLNEHEVLFLRDQVIEPAAQKALAEIFGPLQTHPAYNTVEGLPEVMILESTRENPSKIEIWHSDMTFRQHPPSVTVLRGITIPEVGGDTLFASMTAAYEALSPGMQQYLDGLVAVHDFSHGFKESLAEPGGREASGRRRGRQPASASPGGTNPPRNRQKGAVRQCPCSPLTLRACRLWSRLRSCSFCGATPACRSSPAALTGNRTAWCSGITAAPSTSP